MSSTAADEGPAAKDKEDADLKIAAVDHRDEAPGSNSTPQDSNPLVPIATATSADTKAHISFRTVQPVDVSVRNLAITVSSGSRSLPWSKKPRNKGADGDPEKAAAAEALNERNGEKCILNDVSADMPAGQLMAIIGGSGSGKTSMLNVMAHRMRGKNLNLSGVTTYNGSHTLSSIRHAYVMQQDVLLPQLTVRETLHYSAELRLPSGTPAEERERVVEEVILQLGLKECANTIIGDNTHKGCSGGEKRRVSIGVQLLANPSVLFLDEPTTGLDSFSAFQLVQTLKDLAQRGRTIITTIHQPRSEIWNLFDRITVLTRGNPIFSGKVSRVMPYFESLGHPFPEHENPADFLIDLSATDFRSLEAEEASVARIRGLIAAWREQGDSVLQYTETQTSSNNGQRSLAELNDPGLNDVRTSAVKTPFLRQLWVLTRRTFKTTYRDPFGMSGIICEAVLMGVLAGWIFYKLPGSLSGIRSREAALYLASAMQGYLLLLFETYRLCQTDIKIFDREHGEGVVGVWAFLLSRRLAKLPTEDLPVSLIYSTIYYFMIGFDHNATKFFTFFAVVFVGQHISVCFAMLTVALSRDFSEAALFGNLSYTLQSMACGFFIQNSTMPVYVRWTKYIAYTYYAFGALASNEFSDSFYDCPVPEGRDNPACTEYDGNFILKSLSFRRHWKTVPICVDVAYAVFFYTCAAILLQFFTTDINVTKSRPQDEKDSSVGREKLAKEERAADIKTIDVMLDDYKLSIHKPRGFSGNVKASRDIEILKGVSTRFDSGKLNIIMGPSGSGKSSLLNLMAKRLHSSPGTRYRSSGRMLFNGAQPSDEVIRSLCSYVTQDDDALLPSLTVRETLRYAAALRLPKWMSAVEKERRAEDVILKLGLRDCADNLIGSEFMKGISGGEKRRVTIAVQILTEPRILLLDEPTSGLDAFTAASIVQVIRGLADEGRTVIATIHQSRADLFEQFGNILLLARGGHTIYSGQASRMLPYFESMGHLCPSATNPADFALDLITVDVQHAKKERVSRIKVQSLISRFSRAEALADDTPGNRIISLPAELGAMKRDMAPFRVAFPILVKRSWLNIRRQPNMIIARIMQVVGLGIIVALYFAPLKNDYFAVQSRLGFIQEILPLYFVGMLQNIALYPSERDVFYREHDDRAYSVTSFFMTYTANELPFELITALLFSLLCDLAVGLPRTASLFFVITLNAFCITSCGESIGIAFNTLFTHTGFSVNVMSTVLSIGVLMSGIMSINMPGFLKGVNYLSPMKYAAQNIGPYTLHGVTFTCSDSQRVAGGSCPIENGEQALELYGMGGQTAWKNLVALVVCTIIYRIVAYFILLAKRTQWGVGDFLRRYDRKEESGHGAGDNVHGEGGEGIGGLESIETASEVNTETTREGAMNKLEGGQQ